MKIARYKTRIVQAPTDHPLVFGRPGGQTGLFVTLELVTDDGVEGIGVTFFGGRLTGALRAAVDALAELAIGEDPLRVEATVDRLRRASGMAAGNAGPAGIATLALSAIDLALWDIKGKALDQPLNAMVGGYRDRAPVYASGALTRQFPADYLADAGPRLVELGFRQMKMQLGAEPTAEREVERVRAMRDSVGPDIDIMCDINQLWNVNQAIEIGRRVEPWHLFWLEDVVAHDDYQGLARVADALTTPVCAGEYQYGIRPFRHMLEARSIDIVMIDLLRVGGITQWLKVAGMAEAFNLPVVSHLLPEVHVHLIAGIPNGLTVEYYPMTMRLYEEMPAIEDGQIVAPSKPGLGIAFDKAVLDRYEVS